MSLRRTKVTCVCVLIDDIYVYIFRYMNEYENKYRYIHVPEKIPQSDTYNYIHFLLTLKQRDFLWVTLKPKQPTVGNFKPKQPTVG